IEYLHRFILNITLLFGFAQPGASSMVPGGWSIGIEWVFYLAFPLFLLFARRLTALLLLLAVSFAVNQIIVRAVSHDSTIIAQWANYTNFPTFLVYFVAGIVVAVCYKRLPQGFRLPAWAGRFAPLVALALIFLYPSASAEDYLTGWHTLLLI